MVRLCLALALLCVPLTSGCATSSLAQNSNRLNDCAQGKEAIRRARARTEKVADEERGPMPAVNAHDGAVASVAALLQRQLAMPNLRDRYEWAEVTRFDVPENLPPWLKGSFWSVSVSHCRENSDGYALASNEYRALIRHNQVAWLDLAPRKYKAEAVNPSPAAHGAQGSPPKTVTITSIKAMPFNERTGLLGGDALADDKKQFWNALNTSLFVIVELSGERGAYESQRKVELTARQRDRIMFQRESKVGVLNEDGKYYASFWLYGGFCSPVSLEARLLGQTPALRKTLSFNCGE